LTPPKSMAGTRVVGLMVRYQWGLFDKSTCTK
jgi:hypothetical protein